ncbi:MAG: HEAT repeat domain-containing protein [Planctomycetota bacterium]|nr:HEAT repeat domain-containing protein [Planctomycetota bacterium]
MSQPTAATAATLDRHARAAGMARAAVALATSGLCAFAQAPAPSGIERLVAADAAAALWSRDAESRGEAALILAAQGSGRYEARLLELAEDRDPKARHRALLALGLLATPSAVDRLEATLRTSEGRSDDAGVCAAHALGSVPVDRVATSVARTLTLFPRGSWKRQHDVLVALLRAMSREPARPELGALRLLLREDSNRADEVRGLLWQLLLPIDRSIAPAELQRVLRRGADRERRAIVRWIAGRPPDQNANWIDALTRLAERDRDPELRALALLGLARSKHLPALDLAARALRSDHDLERRRAVETMLVIGGASMRGALERHLLAERDLRRAAALYEGYRAPPSRELFDHLVLVATTADSPAEARVAAAELLARSAPDRAAAILRDLFVTVDDRDLLVRVAKSLSRVGDGPTPLPKLVAAPTELAEHPVRWSALLAAGHPEAQRRVLVTLQDDDAPTAARRSALKAWRMAAVLAPPKSAPPALLRALR